MDTSVMIDTATLGWLLFAAAMAASAITLIVVGLVVKFYLGPRLERKIDHRLQVGAEQLEERIRKRLLDLLTGRSREVIRDSARGLARGLLGNARRDDEDDDDLLR